MSQQKVMQGNLKRGLARVGSTGHGGSDIVHRQASFHRQASANYSVNSEPVVEEASTSNVASKSHVYSASANDASEFDDSLESAIGVEAGDVDKNDDELPWWRKAVSAAKNILLEGTTTSAVEFGTGKRSRLTMRERAAILYEDSITGRLWRLLITIMSMAALFLFVVEAYRMDAGLSVDTLVLVDFIMFWFFFVDFVMRMFIALNKWRRLRQWDTLIDVAAGASVCIAFAGVRTPAGRIVNLSYLRVALTLQFATSGASAVKADNVTRQITRLCVIVLLLIMFAAATFYIVESERPDDPDPPNLYESFYFMIVTYSTVGYGDISAQTALGQAVMMVSIGIGIIVIPSELSALSELLWARSEFSGSYDLQRGEHVILCGDLTVERMIGFLSEFFHPDHGKANVKMVLLSPVEPSVDLKVLLRSVFYKQMVIYLNGSALNHDDLVNRAKVKEALSVFIVSHMVAEGEADHFDARNILRVMAIRKSNPAVPIYVSLVTERARRHLNMFNATTFSAEQYRMQLLATNATAPGFSTMFSQLTNSSSNGVSDEIPWRAEYNYGSSSEVYTIKTPEAFENFTFFQSARAVHSMFGVTMIAVVHQTDADSPLTVLLAPADYSMKRATRVACIAQDSSQMQLLKNVTERQMKKELKTLGKMYGKMTWTARSAPKKVGEIRAQLRRSSQKHDSIVKPDLRDPDEDVNDKVADDDDSKKSTAEHSKLKKKKTKLKLKVRKNKKPPKTIDKKNNNDNDDDDDDDEECEYSTASTSEPNLLRTESFPVAKRSSSRRVQFANLDSLSVPLLTLTRPTSTDSMDSGESNEQMMREEHATPPSSDRARRVASASHLRSRASPGGSSPSSSSPPTPKPATVTSSRRLVKVRTRRMPPSNEMRAFEELVQQNKNVTADAPRLDVMQADMSDPRVARLKVHFDRLCGRRRKAIGIDDLELCLRRNYQLELTSTQAENLMSVFDRDQSGSISFDEFVTVMLTIDSLRDENGIIDVQSIATALTDDADETDLPEGIAALRSLTANTQLEDIDDDQVADYSLHSLKSINRQIERGNVDMLLILSQLSESVHGTSAYQQHVAQQLETIKRWSTYDVSDHLVLAGSVLGLRHVMRVLRPQKNPNVIPIVILHPEEPKIKFWTRPDQLDQVFFVKGSPLEQVDLHRCHIQEARSFIVMHDDTDIPKDGVDDSVIDWKSILSILAAREKCPSVPICAEILHGENVKFFPGSTGSEHFSHSVPFAAGHVWTTALMDSLLVLPYYEKHLLKVLERLLSGRSVAYGPICGAAGPGGAALMREANSIVQAHVTQIAVPEKFAALPNAERTYARLFQFLVVHFHAIPLALYRHPTSQNSVDWYVYTSPRNDARVFALDRVIVLQSILQ